MSNCLRTIKRHSRYAGQWRTNPSKGVVRAFRNEPGRFRLALLLASTVLGRGILRTAGGIRNALHS